MAKSHRVAVIGGDGIGPEVIREALKILNKVSPQLKTPLQLEEIDLGAKQYLKTGEALPKSVFEELKKMAAILLGAVGDPKVKPGILEREILLKIRFDLDLYINLRPCILYEGAMTPLKNKKSKDINFVVVRENTESVYAGLGRVFERGSKNEIAIQEDVHTRKAVERCIRFAFEFCKERNQKKVLTMVDKANVMTHAHDLWRRVFSEVGKEYPQIEKNCLYVDACAMDFVRRPEIFDVVVTNNIFGDILTDLGAIISGGLGLASSANFNPDKEPRQGRELLGTSSNGNCKGLFEPVHGSAPDIAGKGLANPLAAILSCRMMLDFLGETRAAQKIEQAVRKVLKSGKIFKKNSFELKLSTSNIGDLVLDALG